jgi:hypothetical protein
MGKRRRGDSACRRAAIEVLELRRLLSAGAPETDDHAHYGETDADVAAQSSFQNRDWAEPVFVGGPKQWFREEFGITAQRGGRERETGGDRASTDRRD